MVQQSSDFVLSFTANGVKYSASIMEANYIPFMEAYNDQQIAASENQAAIGLYMQQLADYQGQLNAGRTPAPLVKPQMIVVSDPDPLNNWQHTKTKTDFVPPLPDPVQPTIVPSGSIKATTPATDRTDVLLSVVQQLLQVAIATKAEVDAIKAKLGA